MVLAYELPDDLDRVQLGRVGRQRRRAEGVGYTQLDTSGPPHLNTAQHRGGAGAIKAGQPPEGWPEKPAKLCQHEDIHLRGNL